MWACSPPSLPVPLLQRTESMWVGRKATQTPLVCIRCAQGWRGKERVGGPWAGNHAPWLPGPLCALDDHLPPLGRQVLLSSHAGTQAGFPCCLPLILLELLVFRTGPQGHDHVESLEAGPGPQEQPCGSGPDPDTGRAPGFAAGCAGLRARPRAFGDTPQHTSDWFLVAFQITFLDQVTLCWAPGYHSHPLTS